MASQEGALARVLVAGHGPTARIAVAAIALQSLSLGRRGMLRFVNWVIKALQQAPLAIVSLGPRATAAIVLAATAGAFLAAAASLPGEDVLGRIVHSSVAERIGSMATAASTLLDEAAGQVLLLVSTSSARVCDAATSAVGASVAAAVTQTHEFLDAELEKRLGQVAAMASQMVERVAVDKDMPLAVQRIVRQSISRITPRLRAAVGARLRRGLRAGLLGPLSRPQHPMSHDDASWPRLQEDSAGSSSSHCRGQLSALPSPATVCDSSPIAACGDALATPHQGVNTSPTAPDASLSAVSGLRLVSNLSSAPRWLRRMTLQSALDVSPTPHAATAPKPLQSDPLSAWPDSPRVAPSSPAERLHDRLLLHDRADDTAAPSSGCRAGLQRAWAVLWRRPDPLSRRVERAWAEARAGVLYTLNPADKSVWTCAKDAEWWSLNALGTVPVVGQAWWLLLFAMHDRRDEGRLTDFVVSFEAASLCTVGIYSLLSGAVSLLVCSAWFLDPVPCDDPVLPSKRWLLAAALDAVSVVWTPSPPRAIAAPGGEWDLGDPSGSPRPHNDPMCHACAVYGPRASALDAVFFVVQVSLVWAAFALLPFSNRLRRGGAGPAAVCDAREAGGRAVSQSLLLQPWYGKPPRARGGELLKLFWYFTAVAVGSAATVVAILLLGGVNWRTLATAFWIRCAFGLLGAPFALFKLPVIGSLFLLRSDATGYDRFGQVVLRTG